MLPVYSRPPRKDAGVMRHRQLKKNVNDLLWQQACACYWSAIIYTTDYEIFVHLGMAISGSEFFLEPQTRN